MALPVETFNDYIVEVSKKRVPEIRDGQRAFNVLWACRPDLSEQVRGTPIDPFYRDDLLPAFYEWVEENW